MMPHKRSGGEIYWRRYAEEKVLGRPTKIEQTVSGYAISFKSKRIETPFVGGVVRLRRLITDIQRWIDER